MAAKKSSKVKDLPRKSVSTKKASNIKGGQAPEEAGARKLRRSAVHWRFNRSITYSRSISK